MKKLLAIFFMVFAVSALAIPALATNHKFPACHGKNSTTCRPDPNPNGKDCLKHGKGGINEDHCKLSSSPTPTPTSNPTVSPTPTPSGSTPSTPGTPSSGRTKGSSSVGGITQLAKTGDVGFILEMILLGAVIFLLLGSILREITKK